MFDILATDKGRICSTNINLRGYLSQELGQKWRFPAGTRFTSELGKHAGRNCIICRKVTVMFGRRVKGVSKVVKQNDSTLRFNIPGTNYRVKRFSSVETDVALLIDGRIVFYVPPFFEWHQGPLTNPVREAV